MGKAREAEKEKANAGPKVAIDTGDGKKEEVTSADAGKAQKMRRRASQAAVSAHLASQTGRRLSKLEKDLYVVDKAIELANQEEVEEEPVKEKNWKYLPYVPVEGNECDELLAEQLNIFEIDVKIRPIQLKKKKKKRGKKSKEDNRIFYRIQGKKKRVKVIHGVLLVREKKEWVNLTPYLRKLAGLPEIDGETEIQTVVKKKKKRVGK